MSQTVTTLTLPESGSERVMKLLRDLWKSYEALLGSVDDIVTRWHLRCKIRAITAIAVNSRLDTTGFSRNFLDLKDCPKGFGHEEVREALEVLYLYMVYGSDAPVACENGRETPIREDARVSGLCVAA